MSKKETTTIYKLWAEFDYTHNEVSVNSEQIEVEKEEGEYKGKPYTLYLAPKSNGCGYEHTVCDLDIGRLKCSIYTYKMFLLQPDYERFKNAVVADAKSLIKFYNYQIAMREKAIDIVTEWQKLKEMVDNNEM